MGGAVPYFTTQSNRSSASLFDRRPMHIVPEETSDRQTPAFDQLLGCRNSRRQNEALGIVCRLPALDERTDRQAMSEAGQRDQFQDHIAVVVTPFAPLATFEEAQAPLGARTFAHGKPLCDGRLRIDEGNDLIGIAMPDGNDGKAIGVGRGLANVIAPFIGRTRGAALHDVQGRHGIAGSTERQAADDGACGKQLRISGKQCCGHGAAGRKAHYENLPVVDLMHPAAEIDHLADGAELAAIARYHARAKPVEAEIGIVRCFLLGVEHGKPMLPGECGPTAGTIEILGILMTAMQDDDERHRAFNGRRYVFEHAQATRIATEPQNFGQPLRDRSREDAATRRRRLRLSHRKLELRQLDGFGKQAAKPARNFEIHHGPFRLSTPAACIFLSSRQPRTVPSGEPVTSRDRLSLCNAANIGWKCGFEQQQSVIAAM
ncbi:hypothetical protein RHSP_17655 [Rhizobium freirei PRF 81]|uniref:Uncharacterized protein n=1 Tax=Rhizobium freirei PRF 81 TaxID=363754 RepID=N6TZP0_9HYPH|nr:hypothetical protein RHSP_17655 [Rhizobium freirei PRF 81]